MQKYSSLFFALVLGTSAWFHALPVYGDTPAITPSPTATTLPDFRVVDVMRILTDSLAIQDVQKQLEKKSADYQKEFAAQDQKFRSENEQLVASQHTLKPEELQKKQMDLQKRFEKFQEKVEMRRRQLEFAYRQSMTNIQTKIDDIIGRLATEKKLTLVFRDASLAWVKDANQVDMTSEIVTILNKEVPKVTVKIPTEKEMAAMPQAPVPGAPVAS